jgi:adenylate cyclase
VARRNARNATGTERERKFLVKFFPPHRSRYPHVLIEQGYLTTSGRDGKSLEVRMRRTPRHAVLTVKKGHGVSRSETEVALSPSAARLLWPLTRGRRLIKVRYRIPYRGHTVELDVYRGALRGFAVVEVEFPSDRALRRFQPPEWFGREVTGQKAFANSHLAVAGLKRVTARAGR